MYPLPNDLFSILDLNLNPFFQSGKTYKDIFQPIGKFDNLLFELHVRIQNINVCLLLFPIILS